jgi:hypothetical protein
MVPLRARFALALLASFAASGCVVKELKLLTEGSTHELRKRPPGTPPSSPGHPSLLVLGLDGVGRDILYDALRKGEMPALAGLLGGGEDGRFAHAYFERDLVSTMPSTTMAAWVTAFTGVGPAHHGVTGNEFFIREERRFAAPAPVTFNDMDPVLSIYTDQYLNKLVLVPGVYERLRQEEPDILVWVSMHHYYAGADRLLVARPTVIAQAFQAYVEETLTKLASQKESRVAYQKLDEEVVDVVVGALDKGAVPDVLTVYLAGTDLYAHVAEEGPDAARRTYLHEVVDPQIAKLADKLRARGALDGRYVVITADHGHTQVVHDDAHALSTKDNGTPPALLRKVGFRVRPFKLHVAPEDDFQSVLAYQGATAYVYLADRSGCANEKQACDWKLPPRYEEDVLVAADAFYRNNQDGSIVPEMKGTLDLILTRKPQPYAENDLPFEVYVGGSKVVPVERFLAEHPHPTYVELAARLRDLGEGPRGERAGDIVLIAHNGDRDTAEERYYFAEPYHSWHGSPSRQDSEIPLVVGRAGATTDELGAIVRRVLGEHPRQQKVTDLLLALRHQPLAPH